ncbi:MAG: hypothetical protein E6R08_01065 [Nevskiaceae bacterium]|nr:MAG: hypothetical protein E6R08_01065 [Nevskiaceae bacterium]
MSQTAMEAYTPPAITVRVKAMGPGNPWSDRTRATVYGWVMKVALRWGYRVLVVGPTRAGKSYMLSRVFPGRLVDGSVGPLRGKGETTRFHLDELPPGVFVIEELQGMNQMDLQESLGRMKRRQFVLSVQRLDDVLAMGLRELFVGRRTLILELGGQAAGSKR